ncbi:prepilin-type N-terminal cleavage/methylation domain-containing protein [bacterium]|nr:prepilin-type N-terminal cleavage/methylation domain-containing protein [bacterium]
MRIAGDRPARSRAFTLIELLIVVAIIAILATIAVVNFQQGMERALKSSDASNLHVVAIALQRYMVDFNTLPPADRIAGPFQSHGPEFTEVGNGPAAGGSWDGLPWLLYDLHYVDNWRYLFCPRYLKLYPGGNTVKGNQPRYHNFRYAYNSSAMSSGGHSGGVGNIMSGATWMVRDLYLDPKKGWYASDYPDFPADYHYPWGEGKYDDLLELALYPDGAVRTKIGGSDLSPEYSN